MIQELQSILESSGVSVQKEILREMKDLIRWQTKRFVERYCDLKPECQICGTHDNIQYHHIDYTQSLKVNMLCRICHKRVHNHDLTAPKPIDLQNIAIKKKGTNSRIMSLNLCKVEITANYLKRLREQKGLSSGELGELIGVAGSTILNWEKGKSFPRRDAMIKYTEIFNVSLESIEQYISEITTE